MSARRPIPAELLSDSEATLRLADEVVSELASAETLGGPGTGDARCHPPHTAASVAHACDRIAAVLRLLRESRGTFDHAADAPSDQDAARQLAYASALLGDLEDRLNDIVALFDGGLLRAHDATHAADALPAPASAHGEPSPHE